MLRSVVRALGATMLVVLAPACSRPNPAYRVELLDGPASGDVVHLPDGPGADARPADGFTSYDLGWPPPDGPGTPPDGPPILPDGALGDAAVRDAAPSEPPPVDQAPPPPDMTLNPIDAPVPRGTGLAGNYFDGTQLEDGTPGRLDLQRLDALINFDWPRNVSADPEKLDHDYFSVRWLGDILPHATGTYTFTTVTDDGVRLYVNGTLVLQNWEASGLTTTSGPIELKAYQKYPIRMEYRETTQNAVAKLYWTPPGKAMQIVPTEHLFPGPLPPP